MLFTNLLPIIIIIFIFIFLILIQSNTNIQAIGFPIFTFIFNAVCGIINFYYLFGLLILLLGVETRYSMKFTDCLRFLMPLFFTIIANIIIKKFCTVNLKIFKNMILPFIIGIIIFLS